ncbi:MAG: LON peptidase substrate-binding domain-containing protein [Myxococcales bacterium]
MRRALSKAVLDLVTLLTALDRLKVFPLPDAVLLPGGALPLAVFEPRYRALVEEALRGDRMLAIAMPERSRARGREQRARLRPIACLGFIEDVGGDDRGWLEILVRGVARIRILGEHPRAAPFREVRAELADETQCESSEQLATLRAALAPLWALLPEERREALASASDSPLEPGPLCDAIALAVVDKPAELQALLEALDVRARSQRLLDRIGALLFESQPRPPRGHLA